MRGHQHFLHQRQLSASATGHFCILALISSILSSLECIPLETAGHRLSLPPPPGCPLRVFSMCYCKRKSGQQVGQTSSSQLGCGNVTIRAKLKVLGIEATPATFHSFPFKGHCLCSRQLSGCHVEGCLLYTYPQPFCQIPQHNFSFFLGFDLLLENCRNQG